MRERHLKRPSAMALVAIATCCLLGLRGAVAAESDGDIQGQLEELRKQNERLQQQLRRQQELIENLSRKVTELERTAPPAGRAASAAQEPDRTQEAKEETAASPLRIGNVVLSGEAGIAVRNSGSRGPTPNADFRVDEARLFLDAQVWRDVYGFVGLDVAQREASDEYFRLGELYLDVEGLWRPWEEERLVNLRVGRFYSPFGEEYLTRFAIENPLISHSLSDLWALDEGAQLYGSVGRFQYAVAVQNGGDPMLRDYNADKAVVVRFGYDPTPWLHLSLSGMRTGHLDADERRDRWSAMWFGNGFITSLGATNTTTTFHAELVEGDVQARWDTGHVKAAGGLVHAADNDRAARNQRDVYYHYVEGLQRLTPKLYSAARVSQIFAGRGFPLVGDGEFFTHQIRRQLSTDLWRVSLGLGYRWSRRLALKAEYTWNGGHEFNGRSRNREDVFGVEVVFGF